MRQSQKNLFFFFRGAHNDEHADLVLDRQLEDNTTKALIYVLEHADRQLVLGPFLKDLAGLKETRLGEVQFALQRVDIRRPTVRRRIALSIAPTDIVGPGNDMSHMSGRPDAWIWHDDSFSMLIEAKIRGPANRAQIRRHIAGAEGWSSSTVEEQSRTWTDVYRSLARVRRRMRRTEPTTRLLLDEFLRYLRMTSLASDTTFDLDDFGYFLLPAADRDSASRSLLKRKLVRFTEELTGSTELRRVRRLYGGGRETTTPVSPGVFRKDSTNYWITIGPKERRNRCHLTVRLSESGIALEAFSPHKSFTKRFITKIERAPDSFLRVLRPVCNDEPYAIRLREAYFHDPESAYKGRRIGRRADYLEVLPEILNRDNLHNFIIEPVAGRLNSQQLRPEICLVRRFGLTECVGNSNVVAMVASAAEPMLDYLEFALDV